MSSWWAPGSPAWSRPPSSPPRTGRCCCSTASRSSPSAARRTGPSAGCSASTPRSSGGCGSTTRPSSPSPTGWAARRSTDRRTYWPRRWAEAYVQFAAGEQRSWLHERGVRFFPLVQWAERGGYTAPGHGNSVPRFHVTWGTGPGLVEPFAAQVLQSRKVRIRARHRVTAIEVGDRRGAPVRRRAGGLRAAPRRTHPGHEGRGVLAVRAGRGRGQRRDRRQLRPGPAELAGRLGRRARATWSPGCRTTWTAPCCRPPARPGRG